MIQRHEQNGTIYYVYNDNPKLPVIVMLHGYRGTHHGLDLIAKNLDGYRIIVPDLPGFGESKPLPNEHSVKNYVTWLNEFIDGLKLSKPPVLLGHSFGSIIVSHFVVDYPKAVSKLIMVNPIGAPALEGSNAIMAQLASFYYWLGQKLPERIATKLLSARSIVMIMSISMAKTRDKKTRKFIHNQHLLHFSSFTNRDVAAEAYRASISNNVRDVAKKISVPTLMVVGDRDDITPLVKQLELSKLIQNTTIDIIKNVGHLTHYETPDSVSNAIKKFVS
ncbi:MAG: alpha/beta hydrolase [Candidatus Saccharimonadales bacterium]